MSTTFQLSISIFGILLATTFSCFASHPVIDDVQLQKWYKVLINDRKVGSSTLHVLTHKHGTTTTDSLSIETKQQARQKVRTNIISVHEETLDGQALSFRKVMNVPNLERRFIATIKSDKLLVQTIDNNSDTTKEYDLPQPILLFNGVRKHLINILANNKNKTLSYYSWDFTRLDFNLIELKIENPEERTNTRYWKIAKTVTSDRPEPKKSYFYTDAEFYQSEISFQLSGKKVDIIECSEACATKRNKPYNNFSAMFKNSPYRLPKRARQGKIRYELSFSGEKKLDLPNTFEQNTFTKNGRTFVDVCDQCGTESAPDSLDQYLSPNAWVQSDHPTIQKAAKRKAGKKRSSHAKMKALERYVEARMTGKIQYIGYGSALDAYTSKVGDCTEFALLLAALSKSAGIPTRVVIGLAYSEETFEGRDHIFIPHAWVQAWVDDRWKSYDAAYDGFDAGYIALGIFDGNKRDYIEISRHIHQIEITSASRVIQEEPYTP
ncbi:MAG: hypothetical protein COA42_10960 [Alteromonadaceae bacterium]|nr:MAG: hypothetical protein COA42_10960 [Alteromonadaceae bacterium]